MGLTILKREQPFCCAPFFTADPPSPCSARKQAAAVACCVRVARCLPPQPLVSLFLPPLAGICRRFGLERWPYKKPTKAQQHEGRRQAELAQQQRAVQGGHEPPQQVQCAGLGGTYHFF